MSDFEQLQTRIPSVLEDPNIKAIARVYADAFLDAQGDLSADERVGEFRSFIEDVISVQPGFEALLLTKLISQEQKQSLLERTVLSHASGLFSNFLKVLADHDRLDLVRVIFDEVVEENEKRQGRQQVTVRSASPLGDDQIQRIHERLAQTMGLNAVIQVEIDPQLLGGIVIQVGDTVYDSSLRNRLRQMQGRLRERYVHEIQVGRDRFSHSEGS